MWITRKELQVIKFFWLPNDIEKVLIEKNMRKFLYLLIFFIINSNSTHFSKSLQAPQHFFILPTEYRRESHKYEREIKWFGQVFSEPA